jgi:hypothetical protein
LAFLTQSNTALNKCSRPAPRSHTSSSDGVTHPTFWSYPSQNLSLLKLQYCTSFTIVKTAQSQKLFSSLVTPTAFDQSRSECIIACTFQGSHEFSFCQFQSLRFRYDVRELWDFRSGNADSRTTEATPSGALEPSLG